MLSTSAFRRVLVKFSFILGTWVYSLHLQFRNNLASSLNSIVIFFGLFYIQWVRVRGGDFGVWHHFQQYFSYIMAVSFIGGGRRSTRRKPQTCRKSLTNFIKLWCIEYSSPWVGFRLTTLVAISTDGTGSCKSNYHMITIMISPFRWETIVLFFFILEELLHWPPLLELSFHKLYV